MGSPRQRKNLLQWEQILPSDEEIPFVQDAKTENSRVAPNDRIPIPLRHLVPKRVAFSVDNIRERNFCQYLLILIQKNTTESSEAICSISLDKFIRPPVVLHPNMGSC